MPSLYPVALTLRLTPPVAKAVQVAALRRGLTRAAFIRDALEVALRGTPARGRKAKASPPSASDFELPSLEAILRDLDANPLT